jgi:hypothetical protein
VEAHFETEEIMNEVLSSPEIEQQMIQANDETLEDVFFFTDHTARIYSKAGKRKMNNSTIKKLLWITMEITD